MFMNDKFLTKQSMSKYRMGLFLLHDVVSVSDIMPGNKIDTNCLRIL